MSEYILEMKDISKSFPGVKALDHVSFDLKPGEIHALIGENGAGKSTLIKCLGGQHMPSEGEIFVNGEKVNISNAMIAKEKGIGVIYQEFNLVPAFSIAENIYLGREYKKGGMIDRAGMFRDADEVLRSLGQEHLSSKMKVYQLSVSQQQMIEISKAVSANAKIIVFDEPTAVLTQKETVLLFKIIAKLKAEGGGIIYISHRLDEVLEFDSLSQAQIAEIVKLQLKDLKRRLADQEFTLDVDDAALAVLVKDGYDPAYGARPVKRAIQRDLENPIAKLIVSGKYLPGATIKVTAKDGRILL